MPDIGPLIEQSLESVFSESSTAGVISHDSVNLVTTSQSSQETSTTLMVTSSSLDSKVTTTPLSVGDIIVTTLSPLDVTAARDNIDNEIVDNVPSEEEDNEQNDFNSKNQDNNRPSDNEKDEADENPLMNNVVSELIPVLQDQELFKS